MKSFGRVSVCGSISSYNTNPKNLPKGIHKILRSLGGISTGILCLLNPNNSFLVPMLQPAIVFKQLKIEGFIVSKWAAEWQNGIEHNLNLIKAVSLYFKIYSPTIFIILLCFFRENLFILNTLLKDLKIYHRLLWVC